MRGKLDCKPTGQKMSSAHCLRFGDTWWDLFEVDPSTLAYEIVAEVSGSSVSTPYNLTMDTTSPFFVNADATLSGRLVGDFGSATAYPTYDNYMLAIMTQPLNSPVVSGGISNWMMIPREMIDLSGTGCNKIGISFEGFYEQGQRCAVQAGSCLYNQLDDLWLADDTRRSTNHTPEYMLQRWGTFANVDTTKRFDLRLLPRGISSTLLVLSIKADSLRFIVNRSTGVIAMATIGDFTSFSRDGIVYVSAVNTGVIIAGYFLTITNCSTPGILPVAAQSFSLGPLETYPTQFQLYSQNLFSVTDQCLVSLYDSGYSLIDSRIVSFNTTAYTPNRGNQGGNNTQAPASFEFLNPSAVTCAQKCPGFWNIPCFIVTGCWMNILYIALVIVAIAAVIFLTIKTRCCTRPVACLAKSCRSGSKSTSSSRSNSRRSDKPRVKSHSRSAKKGDSSSTKKGRHHHKHVGQEEGDTIEESMPARRKKVVAAHRHEDYDSDSENEIEMTFMVEGEEEPKVGEAMASSDGEKKRSVNEAGATTKKEAFGPPLAATGNKGSVDDSEEPVLYANIGGDEQQCQEQEPEEANCGDPQLLPSPAQLPSNEESRRNGSAMTHQMAALPISHNGESPVPKRTPPKPKLPPKNPFAQSPTRNALYVSPLAQATPPTRLESFDSPESSHEGGSLPSSPARQAPIRRALFTSIEDNTDHGADGKEDSALIQDDEYHVEDHQDGASTPPQRGLEDIRSLPASPSSLPPPPLRQKPAQASPTKSYHGPMPSTSPEAKPPSQAAHPPPTPPKPSRYQTSASRHQ